MPVTTTRLGLLLFSINLLRGGLEQCFRTVYNIVYNLFSAFVPAGKACHLSGKEAAPCKVSVKHGLAEGAGAKGAELIGSDGGIGLHGGELLGEGRLEAADGVAKGAYSIWQAGPQTKDTILFIATGSEVSLCIDAAKRIWDESEGRQSVRVVSMPSVERFLSQKCTYREFVIPTEMTKRVIVEAGSRFGWDRFRLDCRTTKFVTKDDFGASAPYKVLAQEFGFTVDRVVATAKELMP